MVQLEVMPTEQIMATNKTMVVIHLMEAQLPLMMLLALLTTVTMAHCTFQKTAPGKTQATQLAERQRLVQLLLD